MIPIKNVFYMLSYVYKPLRTNGIFGSERFDNVAELYAAVLYRGILTQLKQGLNRDYIGTTETISSIKGKINLSESIKRNVMINGKVVCDYDEYSEDSYLNRILKSTIDILLKTDISRDKKHHLRQIMVFFKNVSLLDINSINWKFKFNRNNDTYRMLISICRFVIKGYLQCKMDNGDKLEDFLEEDMPWLYEKFILEFYKRERKDITASAPHLEWALDDDYDFQLPVMKTDITLRKDNDYLIIDAKYYTKSSLQEYKGIKKVHSPNMYQIYTYVKNKQVVLDRSNGGTVSGMLLYAKTDEQITPNNNRYSMDGNSITVHSLDLNRPFEQIRAELLDISSVLD